MKELDHIRNRSEGTPSPLPESLLKASQDHFQYTLGLSDGTVVSFTDALITGDYAHLVLDRYSNADPVTLGGGRHALPFGRGIDVRISDIVWCCDAGH